MPTPPAAPSTDGAFCEDGGREGGTPRCLDDVVAVTCVEDGVAIDVGTAHAWLTRSQQIS